jgi:glyoxylase-like metal-dependent hydrolase (beta-lactamase superfamily II)
MKLFFQYSPSGFSNVYLMGPEGPGDAIIVDPGAIDINMLSFIENNDLRVRAVLVTHNHATHVRGLATLRKIYDLEVYSASVSVMDAPCTIINDRQNLTICGIDVEVLSIPGHTPDSVAFRVDKVVFTGDSMSAGQIGSTNSAYGSRQLLLNLWQKVLSLPDDTILLPGHGPPSTVRAERLYNVGLIESTRRTNRHTGDFEPPV